MDITVFFPNLGGKDFSNLLLSTMLAVPLFFLYMPFMGWTKSPSIPDLLRVFVL